MKVRGTPSTSAAVSTLVAAALLITALVAVIGSAQAAPQTKVFASEVRLTNAVTLGLKTFTLTLKNVSKNNTVGSANFTAPPNFAVDAATQSATSSGNGLWTVTSDGSRLVTFRADSSAAALKSGQFVQAVVSVAEIPSGCTDAAWTTEAKQSNDFSSSAGNAIQLDVVASDLTPLGSFAVGPPIVTVKGSPPQTIPAIETKDPFTWSAAAKDTCGQDKPNYSGSSAILTPTGLTDATYVPQPGPPDTGLTWVSGVGTVTFTPKVTETGNRLKVTDSITNVNASSTSTVAAGGFFDVTDTICVPGQTERCEWTGGKKNGIIAHADAPTNAGANLGIGFNSNISSPPRANFTCNGASDGLLDDAVVNINPRGFTLPFDVDITYKKSISGNGPASSFVFCDSHDGTEWSGTPTPACTSPLTVTPCIKTQKRTSGGDLLFVLTFTQADPWGGAR